MEIPGTERDLRNFTLHTMTLTMPRPRVLHRFMGTGLCSGISRFNEKWILSRPYGVYGSAVSENMPEYQRIPRQAWEIEGIEDVLGKFPKTHKRLYQNTRTRRTNTHAHGAERTPRISRSRDLYSHLDGYTGEWVRNDRGWVKAMLRT